MTSENRAESRRLSMDETVRLAQWIGERVMSVAFTRREWEEIVRSNLGIDASFAAIERIATTLSVVIPTRRDTKPSRMALAGMLAEKAAELCDLWDNEPEAELDDLMGELRTLSIQWQERAGSVER